MYIYMCIYIYIYVQIPYKPTTMPRMHLQIVLSQGWGHVLVVNAHATIGITGSCVDPEPYAGHFVSRS